MTEAQTLTLAEFLLARIAEDEAIARDTLNPGIWIPEEEGVNSWPEDEHVAYWATKRDARHAARWHPARVLAECEAKRKVVEWHKSWPVLVESPPTFDQSSDDLSSMTLRMSRQIVWATEQEYRSRFGSEPPTGPVLRLLALPYADHPDYNAEWRP